ncbi:MAG: peptide transporter [Pedosphaera sp.]|nr:peptide transporter [Pedosphaera sp.]
MKTVSMLILAACWMTSSFAQQSLDPNAPPERLPKTPEKKVKPEKEIKGLNQKPKSPRNPSGDAALIPKLNGIIIVKTEGEVKKEGAPASTGLVVKDIPLIQGKDFPAVVAPYLGQPMSENKIRDLEDDIILYCRSKNRPLVDVILLDQSIENGILQLWLLEGKVGKVVVENEGHKWFNNAFMLSEVHLRPGDSLDAAKLQSDIEWANRNPFRDVSAQFRQGDALGHSDVVLQVRDQLPVRVYAGYEDSGTKFTGEDRLLAGFNWGNVFGLDHQLNYQYTTDTDFRLVKAHSISYVAPLPWHNTVTLFGSYVDAMADFGTVASGTLSRGESYQASMRYNVPLPKIGKYQHEANAGFDFKSSNNNLEFGGTSFSKSDTHIAQFELGYSGVMPDRWGQTSMGLEGYYSPGGLSVDNDDTHFNKLREKAKAEYFYFRLSAQRVTRLPWDFSWVIKAIGQASNARLLPSEQLGVGGYSTVRGYDERLVNGDDGWLISNELRSPAIKAGRFIPNQEANYLQLLAFLDYGGIHTLDRVASDPKDVSLASVGPGLRFTLSKNLTVRFDYGFQLTERFASSSRSRAHIGVVGSF